ALLAAEERWDAALERWAAALAELPWARADGDERDRAAVLADVTARAATRRDALAAERAAAGAEGQALERERAALVEERAALAAAPYPVPPSPAWRAPRPAARPGAPLYLLCDFGEEARGSEAAIEAALEASGLLDAWVEPDGAVLDPITGDAVLRSPGAANGRTLADVLVPAAAGGVAVEAARRALAAIGFAEAGEEGEGATWVAADGRFRLGALTGAHAKAATAYVGATAREAERARRVAELTRRIDDVAGRVEAAAARVAALAARLARLASEVASFPATREVDEAALRVQVRAEALAAAREALAVAERIAAEAAAARTRAAAALDAAAASAGLAAWARDPGALAERTRAYEVAAERWLDAVAAFGVAARRAAADAERAREALERLATSQADARLARADADALRVRAEALREAAGAAADEVLRSIAEARAAVRATRTSSQQAAEEKSALDERKGAAETEVEAAERAVADSEEHRKEAAEALRALALDGVLAGAGLVAVDEPPPSEWSYTAALEAARRVDAAVEKGATEEQRAAAEDRLMRRQTELQGQLPAEMRVFPSRPRGVLAYEFAFGGRPRPSREVLAELESQVAARTALLGDDERKLIEQFLSGEAHEHLAARLRQARGLVERMNAALVERTTASGAQVRLSWEVDDAHAGAKAAVALFLRAGHLLTEANRAALEGFLQDRLALARDAEGTKPLQERMLEVLDYRPWHRFVVEHRAPGQAWGPLTRKAHASGSGGKKAVMLHLPLFAAAAAFYDAALPGAPRIIALDEAFAGIDRPMRGQLMGLLAEFDLDFVMTSYEEWGFYAELDGLSTYHLSRDPAMPGVHAEWFVWNGREQVLVEEG
ncbi:MAG: TIGR02680 family protein, partial [Anaeromyxobacteraceae bacterium]